MAVSILAGSKQFISPTALNPDTVNAMTDENAFLFFEAVDDWIEVEEMEDFGTIGDTMEVSTFTAVGNKRVRKLGATLDAGTQEIVVGRDPLDDGQEKLFEVMGNGFNYPFKIELNDARTPGHSKSVLYYGGLVLSKPTNMGNVSNVVRRNVSIGVNTGVYEVASGALAVPANVVPPSIVFLGGAIYRANVGSWANSPSSFAYLWEEDDSGWAAIPNSNVQEIEYAGGNDLRVTVTPTNGAGAGAPATSLPVTTA